MFNAESVRMWPVVGPTPRPSPFFVLIEKRSSDVRALGANVAIMYSSVCTCDEACRSV